MKDSWTPEKVRNKVEQLTQSTSPYVSNNYAGIESMVRNNMIAEEWPDEVLERVIAKGPMTEVLQKVCAEVLAKRRSDARWETEQRDRQATKEALAEIKRVTEAGPKPHWSTVPTFWILVATLLAAIVAAAPVVRDWLK